MVSAHRLLSPAVTACRLPSCSTLSEFAPKFVERVQPHIGEALRYWQSQLQVQQAQQVAAALQRHANGSAAS